MYPHQGPRGRRARRRRVGLLPVAGLVDSGGPEVLGGSGEESGGGSVTSGSGGGSVSSARPGPAPPLLTPVPKDQLGLLASLRPPTGSPESTDGTGSELGDPVPADTPSSTGSQDPWLTPRERFAKAWVAMKRRLQRGMAERSPGYRWYRRWEPQGCVPLGIQLVGCCLLSTPDLVVAAVGTWGFGPV